jgi:HSP20 family molecular chaperone IbpA
MQNGTGKMGSLAGDRGKVRPLQRGAVGWPRSKVHEVIVAGDWYSRTNTNTGKEVVIKLKIPGVRKAGVSVTADAERLVLLENRKHQNKKLR